ncbi:RidA family protein [Streptomyces sp. NBC_00554]|uniref:RidA family protein n=1 Tax=Streptomyces sp. NBC_00554 TaxID=2903661 RepID=UPI00352E41C6|nr:RidA family protein [Streptomyces sp. NBC_00554]
MSPAENAEARAARLGLRIPDYADPPYGGRYGTVKAFHRSGPLVFLSGFTPEDREGVIRHPGRLGADVSLEQGREAARTAAVNALGGIRLALGSLDRVTAVVRALCFVVCTPEFDEVHKVAAGATDVFTEVFGPEAGVGGRAAIGVMQLARRNCFELWLTVEADSAD